MNEKLREGLSALVDDEQPPAGSGDVLQQLLTDPLVQREWHRHHLVGEAIRATLAVGGEDALAGRVTSVIDNEPALLRPPRRRGPLLKSVAGLALAASVATLAIIGVRSVEEPINAEPRAMAQVEQPRSALPRTVLASSNRWDVEQRSIENRLNSYLVNHSEYAGYGVQGMLPYARIVGYDTSGAP